MVITVNGQLQTFDQKGISLAWLLTESRVENPDMVTVQLNGEFVKKEDYAKTLLKDQDEVDFLYFMGGGQ